MNEISFALVDKWRSSILVSGSGKEDFFKHACASVRVEAQASAPGAAMKVTLRRDMASLSPPYRLLHGYVARTDQWVE
jgi:hypothetical protein